MDNKLVRSNKTSHVMNLLTSTPGGSAEGLKNLEENLAKETAEAVQENTKVAEENSEISAVDFSSRLIHKAEEKFSKLRTDTSTASAESHPGENLSFDAGMLSDFHKAAEKTRQAAEHFDGAVSNFKTAVDSFDSLETEKMGLAEMKENEKKEEELALKPEVFSPSFNKRKVTVIDESSENDKITNEIQVNLEKNLLAEYNEPEPEFHIVNVMAEILKTKDVPGLMRQYGGCTCDKCIADVTALSLTRLPAKYVVLEKEKTSPMIGFYQSKFRSDIFVAMLRATLDVKEHPHHDTERGKDTTKFDEGERKSLGTNAFNLLRDV